MKASEAKQDQAKVESFTLALHVIEQELLGSFQKLENVRSHVESLPDVLAGEPKLLGTRVAVRQIADLVKRGADRDELARDLDLTIQQVDTAVLFDRVTPRRGRPAKRQTRAPDVPPS